MGPVNNTIGIHSKSIGTKRKRHQLISVCQTINMASINGVLNALLTRFKFDGHKVTPTQYDQRIARRAEGLIKNLLTLEDFKDIEYTIGMADWRIVNQDDEGHCQESGTRGQESSATDTSKSCPSD